MSEEKRNQPNDELQDQLSPEQLNRKVKLNLLWLGIFSIMMLFAGLTSAYIISSGDTFWVDFSLPSAFNISTIIIVISSITLFWAQSAIKKNQKTPFRIAVILTFVLGSLFAVYQFKGYSQLIDNGFVMGGFNPVVNQQGRYGKYFYATYQGKEITYDGEFKYQGEPITDELNEKLVAFAKELKEGADDPEQIYNLSDYGQGFLLYYQGSVLTYTNNQLLLDGEKLTLDIVQRLKWWSADRINGNGDFFMKGEYGKDFVLLYQRQPLEYNNRTFYLNGQQLSAPMLNKLYGQENTSSSYVYIFSGVHLLHWVGGIIALLVLLINTLRNKYSENKYLGVTLAARYWHFLGILWLYLYLFLIIIH